MWKGINYEMHNFHESYFMSNGQMPKLILYKTWTRSQSQLKLIQAVSKMRGQSNMHELQPQLHLLNHKTSGNSIFDCIHAKLQLIRQKNNMRKSTYTKRSRSKRNQSRNIWPSKTVFPYARGKPHPFATF